MRTLRALGLEDTPQYPQMFDTRFWYRFRGLLKIITGAALLVASAYSLRVAAVVATYLLLTLLFEVRQNARRIELMAVLQSVAI